LASYSTAYRNQASGLPKILPAGVMTGNDRRSQVLGIVRHSREPLDDDQLAAAAQMNRVYVNQLCRQLAAEGLVVRQRSGDGKLVNVATAGHPASAANPLPASQRCGHASG